MTRRAANPVCPPPCCPALPVHFPSSCVSWVSLSLGLVRQRPSERREPWGKKSTGQSVRVPWAGDAGIRDECCRVIADHSMICPRVNSL